MYRAMRGPTNRPEEFQRYYKQALDLFRGQRVRAMKSAVTGGTYAVFADRLPKESRRSLGHMTITRSSGSFRIFCGEAPAASPGNFSPDLQSSTTGHREETAEYVDKILRARQHTV